MHKTRYFKHQLLTLSFILTISISSAQNTIWRVGLGAGLPDLLHLAIGYDVSPRNLIILSGSYISTPSSRYQGITLRHNYFFSFSKKPESLNRWYFGQKVNYVIDDLNRNSGELFRSQNKTLLLGLDLGRQFHISNRFTANFDLGVGFNVFNESEFINRDGDIVDFDTNPVYFTSNLTFFYRI
ncbi:MAG: hypothetical protein AAF363_20720 [Bacteroidota bacterium]